MARHKDREKAIQLRLAGKSYSEIKDELGVSKSTLSYWLRGYPLSKSQLRRVRDYNQSRIENFRNTMRQKREEREQKAFGKVSSDIGILTRRDIFISGLFLYWAEGLKVNNAEISLSNTDPAMIVFFMKWLEQQEIQKDSLTARLHLYSDMDIHKETQFWRKTLDLKNSQFRKPYIKQSKRKYITHNKGGFGHGTCTVICRSQPFTDYVFSGIKYIQRLYIT